MDSTSGNNSGHSSLRGKPGDPANFFRGAVNLDRFDDRVDPDSRFVVHETNGRYIRPIPEAKTEEQIDRQFKYNQMMGRNPSGYIFD